MWRATCAGLCMAGALARADIDPNSGIDFVHIGAPGNAPWMGNGTVGDTAVGRGSVAYEYNIGRFEVTTAQWAEFMNSAFDRSDGAHIPYLLSPGPWGAVATTPNNPGGFRWTVPAGHEMYPVGGVTWRTCAIYCNWLCNGKSSDLSAFMNGAYDVSTFSNVVNGFTDQITHNAGAQYWIPTWDEYIKAAHFDPDRFGLGQPGYWTWDNTLGRGPTAGPPGTGEANFGFTTPNPLTIPLGSYPDIQSAWGLLDTAGGAAEWTEKTFYNGFSPTARGIEGSFWGSDYNARIGDTIYSDYEGVSPGYLGYEAGLRIASSVPAPGTCIAFAGALAAFAARKRRAGRAAIALGAAMLTPLARADVDPNSGIDFVHIGAPGNAPWMGDGTLGDTAVGRGSVAYEYNIGRFEVTTAQWAEFMNAAFDRPADDHLPIVNVPAAWGAVAVIPDNAGGFHWTVPAGREMYPVGGVSWRTCAMYCNWLCNGRSSDRSAFLNGAYDVSTFHAQGNGVADQITHNASAQYWIPTWDEYIKAAHFDPNRYGPGQPGYWTWDNTLGRGPTAGPPGTGEANFGFTTPDPFTIPLGSYPDIQSALGLLDTAGGAGEWTEHTFYSGPSPVERGLEGSFWGSPYSARIGDTIYGEYASASPGYAGYDAGLRIASSVPAPGTCIAFAGALAVLGTRKRRAGRAAIALAAAMLTPLARADIDPNSGIDFVHIGAPGNAPWMGDGSVGDQAVGRGSVAYEYNIGRFEVTTGQWAEFMNAAFDRPAGDHIPYVLSPGPWGAVATTPNNAGGFRWTVPAGQEMYPVGGVTWRTCAIYCNWLCNGKSTDRSAFMNGAYDVSTFGNVATGFTDQITHNTNAQYWIPTWDEYIKASHYDPNRYGPSQPGYWVWNNTLGRAAIAGPPGTGEANFGFTTPNPLTIPLGSYPSIQSPWGLLDVAGGTTEWTELTFYSGSNPVNRAVEGSFWGSPSNAGIADSIYTGYEGIPPGYHGYEVGFRIASSVPAPGTCIVFAGALAAFAARKRRSGWAAMALAAAMPTPLARADIDPNSGIDLVHIGAPGNAPWMGNGTGGDQAIGRGSVAYEYNIGRFEVTTAQWAEFMNAAFDRSDGAQIPYLLSPGPWGAVATTPNNVGGFRWTVPAGHEMYPVGGVTWRTCAIYCMALQRQEQRSERLHERRLRREHLWQRRHRLHGSDHAQRERAVLDSHLG